jgi:endogenous inhibitor of DNA gyrase (YacG/DUF329 family)
MKPLKKSYQPPQIKRYCVHCGEDFESRRKDAKFCSGRCKVADFRMHNPNNAKKSKSTHKPELPTLVKLCPGCNHTFWTTRSNKVFCKDACRQALGRRARAAGAGCSEKYHGKKIDKRTREYKRRMSEAFHKGF